MLDSYHHGNLKQELIEQGLRIINKEGEDKLSFRKVAAACGVSHTAAYAHFRDKNDMVTAIRETVSRQFAKELFKAVDGVKEDCVEDKIVALGRRYVSFFFEKPDYFKFLFTNHMVKVHFDIEKEYEEDFPAFTLLKKLYLEMNKKNGVVATREEGERELIRLWSSVHGIAAIACMDSVEYDGDWNEVVMNCIK